MRKSPEVVVSMGKKNLYIFIPLALLFLASAGSLFFGSDRHIGGGIIGSLIAILCGWKVLQGLRRIRVGNLYKSYIHRLSVSSDNKIDNIVSALKTSEKTVRRDLKDMAKEGLFKSVLIDEQGVVHIKGGQEELFVLKSVEEKMGRLVSVRCHACGAPMSIIEGTGVKCEYCGSSVTAPKAGAKVESEV